VCPLVLNLESTNKTISLLLIESMCKCIYKLKTSSTLRPQLTEILKTLLDIDNWPQNTFFKQFEEPFFELR
jgi:hypothetical protein